jgi:hypothetical protein
MTTSPENLVRRASALALRNGWEVLRTLSHDDGELRQLVAPSGSVQPAELCIRAAGARHEKSTPAEIEALQATRSEHVLRLLEVLQPSAGRMRKSGGPPPALLLEHAPGGDLTTLLDRRDSIRAGEASTILLSVAQGLDALHRGGWAHGALTAHCVVFRRDGCPAIASLENARPVTIRSVYDDRSAFLQLAERVSGSIAHGEGDRMLVTVRGALGESGWDGVARALIAVAEPEAVLLPFRPAEAAPPEAASGRREMFPLGTFIDGHPIAAIGGSLREWARSRKKLIALAVAPLVAAAVVLALLPGEGDPGRSGAPQSSVPASSAPSASPPVEASTPMAAEASAKPASVSDAGDESDDPVRAAEVLLGARHACFAVKRPVPHCLEGSVQAASPLFLSDAAAMGAKGAAAERDLRGFRLGLVQRWGDAALISVTPPPGDAVSGERSAKSEPASLLMIRNEAGWRLREVYP